MDQQKENDNNEIEEDQFPTDSAHRISPFIDRYFQKYYKIYEPFSPQYAFQHSNRLFMIGITAEHPIVKSSAAVNEVSFTPIGADNCKTFVKGKKKKGAIKIQADQILAKITLSDGTIYSIKSPVEGFIIELNEHLFVSPQYLQKFPESKGFLALISFYGNQKKNTTVLLESNEYQNIIQNKQ